MKSTLALVSFLAAIGLVAARDWHSMDGRTLPGEFVKVTGETLTVKSANGQPVTVSLKILSAEDQSYAQAAQALNEGAVKLGPQAFEVALNYGGGSLCRFPLTRMKATDPLMFAGEQFFLVGEAAAAAKKGSQLKDQFLFFAGNRTLHPLQGDAFPVRSFALTADQALAASSSPPDIYEPMIEQIEVRGLGYPISDSGLILVDGKLLVSINSLVVDLGKDLENATVVANNSDLGIAIIAAKSATTAMRLAPRKPLELGQPVTLLSLKHGEYAKSLEDAIVTQGTITNLSAANGPLYFEHNAPRDPDAVGGLVLSDKGDVIGLMTQKTIIKRGTSKDGVITREPLPENLLA
ncbi:MAG: trypsin-like peptidase domain-containing protein, partial [Prosthecobacter sp.]|uniref:trypsin-like peptidase domain-containing protein n=1 Tax=Prosthecobacter sp. TaxID=1965333 RepID=UPI0038FFC37A